jgi:DNA-binding HxlR family transcriptional regulator
MADKRTYGDRCGIARALDIVGDRWALLIIRELLLGPKRFTDLRAGLPGVSADILTARLRDLDASGVVRKEKLPPPAASQVYELTKRGRALETVILDLGRWGSVAPFPPGDDAQISTDALVIALKTLFDPRSAKGIDASYELRLNGDVFTARVHDGEFDVARGAAEAPDATITAAPRTLAAVLWHGRPIDEVAVDGKLGSAGRFLAAFPLPTS